ncbi:MAG TPA: hypothetical protein VLR89_07350, partial [Anaerolineaceae bacterium]|nr:hypothetical protein [Anaerolineaceae bacterium]
MQKLHETMQLQNQDLAILEERSQSVERSLQQLEVDKGSLNEIIQSDRQTLETLQAEILNLETTLKDTQAAKDASWQKLDSTVNERQNLDRQRNEVQSQLMTAEKELIVFRSRQQDLNERLESSQLQKTNHTNSLKELNLQEKVAKENLEKAEATLAEIESSQKEIEVQRAKLNEERIALARQTEQNLNQINRLNIEKNKASSRLDLLNQSQASLAGFSEGAKSLLKLAAQKKAPGMMDLASKLEIPQEFEVAIAAALGEALDVLILSDGSKLEGILQNFGREVTDRVALTDLSWGDVKGQKTPKTVDGVIGLASEIIKTTSGLDPVLARLLGNYLIVKDLNAVELAHNANPGMNIVTLAGEVYLNNGVVLLGRVKTGGKVSYLRTRKELEAELQAVDLEHDKTSQISKSLQDQKDALQHLFDQLTKKEKEIREKLTFALQTKNNGSLSLAKLNNQRDWLTRQVGELEKVSATAEENLDKLKISIQTKDLTVKSLMEKVDEIRSLQREKQTDELQRAFSNLETEYKVLNQRLNLRQAGIKEAEARLKSEHERLVSLETRQQASASNFQAIAEQIKLKRQDLEATAEQAKASEAQELDPQLAVLGGLEKELESLEAEVNLSQKDLTNRDRLVTHFQLEYARQQEKLNALRARIDDDFGLIELEYRN